jgi:transposase
MPPAEQLYAENCELKTQLDQARARLQESGTENALLRAQIAWLKKQLFGGGKSERLDRAQLLLQLEALEQRAEAAACAHTEKISYERTKGAPTQRPTPAQSFAHLPVQETITIEPEEVKAEPAAYERIGEERTFEVDITPPRLFKREIVRPKYRRRDDRTQPPVVAAAPARPVAGGYASAGLIAWVLLCKYVEHLPLFRQEKMSVRWGARISRKIMADWVGLAAGWLEPICRQMLRDLLAGGYVQCDETPIRCHDPDLDRGQTTQGWLWVVSRPGGDVVFEWRLSRRHEEVTSLLDGYQGLLQSDGYEAYPNFVAAHPGVVWLGCWAHARRQFFEAQAEAPKAVRVALKLIARLYRLETEWDQAGITDAAERARLREKRFERSLRWLRSLALVTRERVLPQSLLGKACSYLLNHWGPLTAHLDHGRSRLDNNLVENAIRPSAIGKKNWLFIGHPDAGQRSAIVYSIVVSCQRHGIDPFVYLKDVLARLPTMTNQDDLSALTPANWLAGRSAQQAAATPAATI